MLRSSRYVFCLPLTLVAALAVACTSSAGGSPADGGSGDASAAMCTAPGQATPGPRDTHCTADDGGTVVQPTSAASCHPDAPAVDGGGGMEGCPYGDTLFGQEADDDDDCKYHVAWTSTPICEGAAGVSFKVVVTNKSDGSPATGARAVAETFTTTPGDASCDNASTHPGPNSGVTFQEGPPGTYSGQVVFDAAGAWTVRFHFHEECADLLDDSPHGHAAFHISVP